MMKLPVKESKGLFIWGVHMYILHV